MKSQNFSLNSHLLKFISLSNDLRNNLLSNHADDTNDFIDHYHIVLFVVVVVFIIISIYRYSRRLRRLIVLAKLH